MKRDHTLKNNLKKIITYFRHLYYMRSLNDYTNEELINALINKAGYNAQENPDDDIVRFTTKGIQRMVIDSNVRVTGDVISVNTTSGGLNIGDSYGALGLFGNSENGSHFLVEKITLSEANRNVNNSGFIVNTFLSLIILFVYLLIRKEKGKHNLFTS